MRRGRLRLEDGSVFEGVAFGAGEAVAGEVVFSTGMVGYPESLTDPSYAGQILVLTYPLVGNYGVPAFERDAFGLPRGFESERIQAAGLVVWEHSERYSHQRAARSLDDWLRSEGIPALAGVDTRAVTKLLRLHGTMLGALEPADADGSLPLVDPNATDLVATVTVPELTRYDSGAAGAPTVVLLDCGAKASIVRSLLVRGMNVVRVPHDHYFPGLSFDGLVISNGPGDPTMCRAAIRNIERALALDAPILGICLGNQLLALAAGAETYKLPFGHRSQNQPCVEVLPSGERGRRCVITSQNHGYAVRSGSLPDDWRLWFVNANDGTVEGIRHQSKPRWSVQFHPEANPGPVDSAWIFDDFAEAVARGRR
jgi:carbamoyl-phosphate synthase small subunit